MNYREFKRNLFTIPKHFARVHCISQDAEMGKGIAELFAKEYPEMRDYILSQDPNVGDCILYVDPHGQWVLNLVTKKKYNGKPTYKTMEAAISSLRYVMIENSIKRIAMPAIGCGLDRLEWDKVSGIIKNEFKEDPVKIAVCFYK